MPALPQQNNERRKMTIEQHLQAIKLDQYKDRTGDYHAIKVPEFRDFVVSIPIRRCAICGEAEGTRKLHRDHNHTSGQSRALLCHGCNIAIGMIKEDAATARAIADYLEQHASKQ